MPGRPATGICAICGATLISCADLVAASLSPTCPWSIFAPDGWLRCGLEPLYSDSFLEDFRQADDTCS